MNFTMQNYEKLINDFTADLRLALIEKATQYVRMNEFDDNADMGMSDEDWEDILQDEESGVIADDYMAALEKIRVKYSLDKSDMSPLVKNVLSNVKKSLYRVAAVKKRDPNDSVRGDGKYPELDEFLDMLEEKQKNHISPRNVNVERYGQFRACLQELTRIVKETSPDAVIEYTLNTEVDIGNAAIRIEADEFVVYDIQKFVENIQYATNFEVYPLENGNIKIGIMFHGMMT